MNRRFIQLRSELGKRHIEAYKGRMLLSEMYGF